MNAERADKTNTAGESGQQEPSDNLMRFPQSNEALAQKVDALTLDNQALANTIRGQGRKIDNQAATISALSTTLELQRQDAFSEIRRITTSNREKGIALSILGVQSDLTGDLLISSATEISKANKFRLEEVQKTLESASEIVRGQVKALTIFAGKLGVAVKNTDVTKYSLQQLEALLGQLNERIGQSISQRKDDKGQRADREAQLRILLNQEIGKSNSLAKTIIELQTLVTDLSGRIKDAEAQAPSTDKGPENKQDQLSSALKTLDGSAVLTRLTDQQTDSEFCQLIDSFLEAMRLDEAYRDLFFDEIICNRAAPTSLCLVASRLGSLIEKAAEVNDERVYDSHYERLNQLTSFVIKRVEEMGNPILLMRMPEEQAGCFLSACSPKVTEQLLMLRLIDPKINHGLLAGSAPLALEQLDSRVLASLIEKLDTHQALTVIGSADSILKGCAALRSWFKEEGCQSHPYSTEGLKDKIDIISGVTQQSEQFKNEALLLNNSKNYLQALYFIRPETLRKILEGAADTGNIQRINDEVGIDLRDVLLLAQNERLNSWAISAAQA